MKSGILLGTFSSFPSLGILWLRLVVCKAWFYWFLKLSGCLVKKNCCLTNYLCSLEWNWHLEDKRLWFVPPGTVNFYFLSRKVSYFCHHSKKCLQKCNWHSLQSDMGSNLILVWNTSRDIVIVELEAPKLWKLSWISSWYQKSSLTI